MELQRQGQWGIPPCRKLHVSPFDEAVDDAELRDLIRRHGFDVDAETEVVEYSVHKTDKGNGVIHRYGFVTFRHLAAAIRCVRQLDPMGFAG